MFHAAEIIDWARGIGSWEYLEIYSQRGRKQQKGGQVSYKAGLKYLDKQTYSWELTFWWQEWDYFQAREQHAQPGRRSSQIVTK